MRATTRLAGLIWPFVAVVLAQLLVAGGSIYTMSAVRGYVGGEGVWSKGQKDAIYNLHLYAETRDEAHFDRFGKAIAVPLADRTARLALEQEVPDLDKARAGFLAGGIHPRDIPAMIWLFRTFRDVSYLARSIDLWATADPIIVELSELGETMHREIRGGTITPTRLAVLDAELDRIDRRITPLAAAFSQSLGEGSRFIRSTLIAANVFTAAMLILLAVWRTAILLRQRQSFEWALKSEKERVQITLASIAEAVVSTDFNGRVDFMNPAAAQLIGCPIEVARGRPLCSLFRIFDERTGEENRQFLTTVLAGTTIGSQAEPQRLTRPDGTSTAVSLVGSPLRIDGVIAGAVIVLHDRTVEQQFIAKLSWQASHDALTDLANRREFERRLEDALGRHARGEGSHALMFLDLDQFKIVNDTCGHAAGDELLKQVSAAIGARLREHDLLARLGGDEFGVLLLDCSQNAALLTAEDLRSTVENLPFVWNDRSFAVSASIGLVHAADAHGSLEESLRAADVACYMAKEKGRNRVQVHHAEDLEVAQRVGEMAWVQRIRQALEEDRFLLYAQEIVSLDDDGQQGAHVEILLRLRDEHGGMVMPGAFLPPAERYGLMPLIDRWVVRKAFATLAHRRAAGDVAIDTCAINLSGASFGDHSFVEYIREQIEFFGIEPGSICFEITETSAIANLDSARRFIGALKELGFRFSLDDFGTGMSSFAYLKNLPVDYLKIDGSFVRDMLRNRIDRAMVEMIAHIGHVTGKRTIAEFVEDADTVEALRDIGIDYAQGYAIARPRALDSDLRLLGGTEKASPQWRHEDQVEEPARRAG